MNNYLELEQQEKRRNTRPFRISRLLRQTQPSYGCCYMVFHLIISFFAVYLSWYCNRRFDLGSFVVALLFPHIYILYILSTRGGCGVFESSVMPIARLPR